MMVAHTVRLQILEGQEGYGNTVHRCQHMDGFSENRLGSSGQVPPMLQLRRECIQRKRRRPRPIALSYL